MSATARPDSPKVGESAAVLADLVEVFTNRLRAGEAVDAEAFAAAHPEHAGELREVLPALQVLAGLPPSARSAPGPGPGGSEPAPGVLGDFRIGREVGRGGMGIVYEAEQLSLRRRVAVKVLPFAATMDPRQLARFHNEARAAAGLQHQHIVPVYFVGCERGVHFYAMQFVDGQSLAELIAGLRRRGGPGGLPRPPAPGTADLEPTEPYTPSPGPAADSAPRAAAPTEPSPRSPEYFRGVARLGVQAAEALEHAHSFGVIHRDIKPGNLMLDGRGNVWVTDFGLAHCRSQAGLTRTDERPGTLRYMSPEQALAKHGLVDPRTDVYSLGATLYELLTLEPALDGRDEELLRQIAFEEPRPPRKLNKAIPADLQTIVLNALEKDPADRYATAQALADDLRRFLENKPICARRPGLGQRLQKWAWRNWAVVRVALGLSALLTATLVASIILVATAWAAEKGLRAEAEGKARLARAAETQEAQHRQRADRQREAAERRLYLAHMHLAYQAWRAGNIARVQELLESHRPRGREPDLRAWEWYYLQTLCHRDRLTIQEDPPSTRIIGALPPDPWVYWSPDGRRLAWVANQERGRAAAVHLWDLKGKPRRLVLAGHPDWVASLTWSPDGRRLATGSFDRTIRVWEAATGKCRRTFRFPDLVRSVAWSPNGKALAVTFDSIFQSRVRFLDPDTGRELPPLNDPQGGGGPPCVAWSPDGRHLAYVSGQGLRVADLSRGQKSFFLKRWNPSKDMGSIDWLAWSPDGRRLAWGGNDQGLADNNQIWEVATRKRVGTFPGCGGGVASPWSPDGKHFVTVLQDRLIKVWDAATGREVNTLRGHVGRITSLAWSPDGKRLASTGQDWTIKTWDPLHPQESRFLDPGKTPSPGWVGAVRWKPAGQHFGATLFGITVDYKPGIPLSLKELRVWEKPDLRARTLSLRKKGERVESFHLSPDGRCCSTVRIGPLAGPTHLILQSLGSQSLAPAGGPAGALTQVVCALGAMPSDAFALGPTGTTLTVRDIATGEEVRNIPLDGFRGIGGQPWSPDGRHLVGNDLRRAVVWDVATGREIAVLAREKPDTLPSGLRFLPGRGGPEVRPSTYAWSPDGRRLAGGCSRGPVRVWDTTTWQELLPLRETWDGPLAWSPDGERLASAAGPRGAIHIWRVSGGDLLRTLPGHGGRVGDLAWSPDGQRLASSSSVDRAIKLWDLTTGEEIFTLALTGSEPGLLSWSPDGRQLASASWDTANSQSGLYIWDATTSYQGRPVPASPRPQGEEEADKAQGYRRLGNLLRQTGRHPQAEEAYRQAVKVLQKLVDDFPSRMAYRRDLAGSYLDLGRLLREMRRHVEAEAPYARAGSLLQSLMGLPGFGVAFDMNLSREYLEWGDQLRAQKRFQEARRQYRRALHWQEQGPRVFRNHMTFLWVADFLATCPDPRVRDSGEAVAVAQRAVNLCRQLLAQEPAQHPDGIYCRLALGDCYHRLAALLESTGRLQEAEKAWRSSIDHNEAGAKLYRRYPHHDRSLLQRYVLCLVQRYLQLGNALRRKGQFDEAIAEYRKAICIQPDYPEAHINLGNCLADKGKPDDAIAEYREAIRLKGDDPEFHRGLGLALENNGQLDEAITEYRRAIRINPGFSMNPRANLARALAQKGLWEEAVAEYRKSISCDRKEARARLNRAVAFSLWNRGRALLRKGRLEEAIDKLREALAREPKLPAQLHFDLGNALAGRGQWDEAISAYREAIRLKPDYPDAHYNLGNALADKGQTDEAIACYREAIRLKKDDPDAHLNLGIALRDKGRLDEAIACYREAIRLDPKSADSHNALAWLLATCPDPKLRDYPQAVQSAKKAVQLAPGEGNNWNTLGVALYRTGAWKEALSAVEKSMELRKGGDSWDWFILAMAYRQLGEKEKARRGYDRAVQWMEKNQPKDKDRRRRRREAAELLRVEKEGD